MGRHISHEKLENFHIRLLCNFKSSLILLTLKSLVKCIAYWFINEVTTVMVLQWQGRVAWLTPGLTSHVCFISPLLGVEEIRRVILFEISFTKLHLYEAQIPNETWNFNGDLSLRHHQEVIEIWLYNIMLWLFPVKIALLYEDCVILYEHGALFWRQWFGFEGAFFNFVKKNPLTKQL